MEEQKSPEARIGDYLNQQAEPAPAEDTGYEEAPAVSEDDGSFENENYADAAEDGVDTGDLDTRAVDEDQGVAEVDDDGYEISTLSELAEAIEFDPADFYALKIPVTNAKGEREEVTLGELKDIHQKQTRTQATEEELRQQQENFQKYQAQLQQQYSNELQAMTASVQQLEDMILSEFKSVDWEKLRVTNPQEYAALSVDYDRKKKQLENARNSVSQRWEQYSQANYATQTKQYQERLAAESQALHRAMGWQNEEQAAAEKANVVNYLRSGYGLTEQELSQVIDHRLVVLADKARRYDELQKSGAEQKKRVLKLNGKKLGKPGARRSKAQAQQDARQVKRAALKKSGNVRDAAALIADRLR